MFCNRCGTPLQSDYNLCPKCGQALVRQGMPQPDPNRLERHLHTLGILWMIAGGLFLIPAIILFILGSAAGMVMHGNQLAAALGPAVLYFVASTFLLLAAGGVLVGRGLVDRRSWARTTALILGVLALFHPPLGTALGIYTLWVLLSADADARYQQLARTA